MTAPERFQVGDLVRCVGWCSGYLEEGHDYMVTAVDHIGHVQVDGIQHWWNGNRFVRPTPPALDPFAWAERQAGWIGDTHPMESTAGAFVAWSRFCYWATSVNLAAHFLPTQPAARTRASNGRDVPAATVLVELPVDVVEWWARPTYHFYVDRNQRMAAACRRALGGGA